MPIIELNYIDGGSEKIQVSPIGEVEGLDGRTFKIDADIILEKITKNNLHIPLDINHSFSEAVGWFDKASFEKRDDGIYAKLELNEAGKKLVAAKSYRYLSPVYQMDYNSRNVISLQAVGLVNLPNLLSQAINKVDNNIKENIDMSQNEQLNFEERNKALETENNALKTEISTQRALMRENLIANAINSGELLPANQKFANALTDEQLKEYLQLQKVELNRLKTDTGVDKSTSETITDAELAVNKQLGLK